MTVSNRVSPVSSTHSHSENNFDFLRLLFATAVIFSHSYVLIISNWIEPLNIITRGQMDMGAVSVDCFFVISGFLITASWLRSQNFWGYLLKRILRIYPAFIVASILCVFVLGSFIAANTSDYLHHLNLLKVLVHTLTLGKPDNVPTIEHLSQSGVLNGSMWSIKPEFECYLFTAGCGILGIFRKRIAVLGLTVVIASLNAAIFIAGSHGHVVPETLSDHVRLVTYYICGMCYFLYRDKIPVGPTIFIGSVLALAAMSFTHTLNALSPIPMTYSLMYLAFLPIPHLNRFAKYFDASYGMYLYGWPVQQFYLQYVGKSLNPLELFALAAPTTFLCARASWYLIEKPFLKMKPKSAKPVSINIDDPTAPDVSHEEQSVNGQSKKLSNTLGSTVD